MTTTATLDFASKYVWHGVVLVNDTVFQPGITIASNGFELSLWGSMELTNSNAGMYRQNPCMRFTEFDAALGYSGTLGSTGWNLSVVDYQYPGTTFGRYREARAGIAWERSWGEISATFVSGIEGLIGTYATFGASGSIPIRLARTESIDLGFELSYGDTRFARFVYGAAHPGFTDAHLSAGATFDSGRGWTLTPILHASTLLDPGLLRGAPRRSNLWVNCTLAWTF